MSDLSNHISAAAAAHLVARIIVTQHADLVAYVDRRLPPSLRGLFDPADIAQDACAELLKHADSYDPVRDPAGRKLLFTIARRRITRLMERAMVSRQLNESSLPRSPVDPVIGLLEQLSWHDESPDVLVESRERLEAVRAAIKELSPDHAEVLHDRCVNCVPSKVVAERMGRSPAAVDKLFARASRELASRLRALRIA